VAEAKGHRSVVRAHRTLLRLAAPVVLLALSGCTYAGIAPTSRKVASLYNTIFTIAAIVFAFVIVWLLLSLVLFRRKKGDTGQAPQREGRALFVVGFFLFGAVIVSALFPFGERTLAAVDKIQKNTQVDLTLEGFQWEWTAYYKDEGLVISGKTLTKPLVFAVPVDTPIHVTLVSRDVMHEFFVPQLLFMRNAVPGHPNVFTFTPDKIGTYPGQCAQFCGLWHSRMTFEMKVLAPIDYQAWVTAQKNAILKATCPAKSGSVSITAHDISWNTNCLSIVGGQTTTITVINNDPLIDHNFAIYDGPDRKQRLFVTGRFSGVATRTDTLPSLPPGHYYFQCEVHGPAMSGVFIVNPPGSSG
jgi:cytochrome c oxidase subunit II